MDQDPEFFNNKILLYAKHYYFEAYNLLETVQFLWLLLTMYHTVFDHGFPWFAIMSVVKLD